MQSDIAIALGDFASAVPVGELALSPMKGRDASKVDIANTHMQMAASKREFRNLNVPRRKNNAAE